MNAVRLLTRCQGMLLKSRGACIWTDELHYVA